jgi:8-oxo-dGTP pyrophosphatase MutT (NUDIX family)
MTPDSHAATLRDWSRTVEVLEEILAGDLPGAAAQEAMAPSPRPGWKAGSFPAGCRDAAVLVLVYPMDGRPTFVLTKRTTTVDHHRGQVSFPGGAFDDGEDAVACAIRETEEELGLTLPDLRVLGRLSDLHVPVSGFRVTPVVAALGYRPEFRPGPEEVASVHEIPLTDLLDLSLIRFDREHDDAGSGWMDIPWFDFDGQMVWGATAIMLGELRAVLEEAVRREEER